ncbi:MAG: hypothetical protein D3917_11815 [Candidatus Electrothrix sp. AX5]|nr:hypothetical protein [Candidatus Electrothrix sp. AX5]
MIIDDLIFVRLRAARVAADYDTVESLFFGRGQGREAGSPRKRDKGGEHEGFIALTIAYNELLRNKPE